MAYRGENGVYIASKKRGDVQQLGKMYAIHTCNEPNCYYYNQYMSKIH